MEKAKLHIVEKPRFAIPKTKVKFDGSYFKKRMREIRKSLPKGMG